MLTLDGGGTSTDVAVVDGGAPHLTTEGRVGRFPVKVPMTDVVTVGAGGGSIACRAPDGRLRVGPRERGRRSRADVLRPRRRRADGDRRDAGARAHPAAPARRRDPARRGPGAARASTDWPPRSASIAHRTAAGVLEIAAWSQANAVRQVTVKRGLDVRDYVLVAFGGSGPLAGRQAGRHPRLARGADSARSGNVSAFGLLTVDIKNDYVTTAVQRDDRLDLERVNASYARLAEQARAALAAEGFAEAAMRVVRSADMRYFGQAWEVRVEVPDGPLDRDAADSGRGAFPRGASADVRLLAIASSPDQRIEWVNLRVMGIGPIRRPPVQRRPRGPATASVERALSGRRQVVLRDAASSTRRSTPGRLAARRLRRRSGDRRGVRLDDGRLSWPAGQRRRLRQPAAQDERDRRPTIDPIVLEIVEGTLASAEAEVEAAIERTARSPMIREARDFRGGIHDRHCRKLTGRSYSALVQPIVRDFPIETMQPGDVFFHNDVYQSEGGIGHLPDLCVTVPVHHDGAGRRLRPGIRPPRRHRRRVPGSMPSHGTSYYQEGLIVPPVRLYRARPAQYRPACG